ncbi:hypothetical protein BMR1_03g00520 [Babesia microti strain RI]|uniref:Uncharacterized protein n=1 Tax=Babesia microti (strain RI) TaxID=1133968 RepID=A0A1R4AB61_BABMR|nr:hypothetical protein BMR1_03g00520 [Babesia microti strain RI]SJK86249.1 hypothetical protein BMR1_03g00520 [Babesia microti strain RI]|eukprot:XP_021338431.1 hypothetical protein BMR1_03g00520 [Babesia microti strain RI]
MNNDIRGVFVAHELVANAMCSSNTSNIEYIKLCNKCNKITIYSADLSLTAFESAASAFAFDIINKNINDSINYSDSIPPVASMEIDKLSKTLDVLNTLDNTHTKALVDAVKKFNIVAHKYANERILYEIDHLKDSHITTLSLVVSRLVNLGNAYTTLGLASLADLMGRKSCQSLTLLADQLCINTYNNAGSKSPSNKVITNRNNSNSHYRGSIADEMNVITRIMANRSNDIEEMSEDDIFEISKMANMDLLRKLLPNLMNILHIDTKPSLQMFIKELSL